MLSLRVGVDTPQTMRLWKDKALRGIRRNRRFYKEILGRLKPVWVESPGGVIFGRANVTTWDAQSHDEMIIRITRGLYFHHYGDILSPDISVDVFYFSHLDDTLQAAFNSTRQYSIGGNQFVYRTGRATDAPSVSIWLYQFHERHWAGAVTDDAKLADIPGLEQ